MNRIDLSGRIAVVTGAAKGIGYACAARFLDSGAAVSLWDFDSAVLTAAAEKLAARGDVHAVTVDCGNEAAVGRAMAETLARFSKVDIMIANAGVAGVMKPAWEHTMADWDRLIRNDLTSVFLTCRAAVPGMIERGYGRIVVVSSVAGLEAAANNAAYGAAKAGAVGFTKTLGRELAKTGVLANCIAPSGIDTPLLDAISEDYMRAVIASMPMGRLGTADEVAALVAWLASEECSFSAGAVFDCSGGRADY
jgi:2-dehydro-3-deoxy-L-rhamnonate dehydrogenase (NAD+)